MQFINAYQFSTLIYTLYITPAAPDESLPPCPKARLKSPSPRALLLGVHVGHDGPNFAQNVGPAKSRHQHDDCAGDPFEDVPGLDGRPVGGLPENSTKWCAYMCAMRRWPTAWRCWAFPVMTPAHYRHDAVARCRRSPPTSWCNCKNKMPQRKSLAASGQCHGDPKNHCPWHAP